MRIEIADYFDYLSVITNINPMKLFNFFTLLLSCVLLAHTSGAQTGWRWGRTASTWGPADSDIEPAAAASDRHGGIYVAPYIANADSARFGAFVVHNPSSGYSPVLIARMDSAGNYLWIKHTENTDGSVVAMASDPAGYLYIFGYYDYGNFSIDTFSLAAITARQKGFLMKMAPDGSIVWLRQASDSANFLTPGRMVLDARNNIYVTGAFSTPATKVGPVMLANKDVTGVTADIFLAKFNAQGTFQWAKSYGTAWQEFFPTLASAAPGYLYFGFSVPEDSSVTIGTTVLPPSRTSVYALTDTNGNVS